MKYIRVAENPVKADSPEAEKFIKSTVDAVSEKSKDELEKRLRDYLTAKNDNVGTDEEHWKACAKKAEASTDDEHEARVASYLLQLACERSPNQKYIAKGLYQNWIVRVTWVTPLVPILARGLLGLDGKPCPGAEDLNDEIKKDLAQLSSSAN